MVTVQLKHIHVVRSKLRDGWTEYHYAWRGGPRLKGEPGSPEYVASLWPDRAWKVYGVGVKYLITPQ